MFNFCGVIPEGQGAGGGYPAHPAHLYDLRRGGGRHGGAVAP